LVASLVKFHPARQAATQNGWSESWRRLDVDGLPYRGPPPPYLSADEYDRFLHTTDDVYVQRLNLCDDPDLLEYQVILDYVKNGRYQLLGRRFWQDASYNQWVIIEYAVSYKELHPQAYRRGMPL
jgi:hypothetical protein